MPFSLSPPCDVTDKSKAEAIAQDNAYSVVVVDDTVAVLASLEWMLKCEEYWQVRNLRWVGASRWINAATWREFITPR